MVTFGEELKRIREELGISQESLAATVGLSQGAISQVEKGLTKTVGADVLFRLARALGVPATHFEPFLLGEVPTTKRKK